MHRGGGGIVTCQVHHMGRYPVEGSGLDCKSSVSDSVGSIPTLPTIWLCNSTAEFRADNAGVVGAAPTKATIKYYSFDFLKIFCYNNYRKLKKGDTSMVEHVKLKISATDEYEWLINDDTGEVLIEGIRLSAEDVLWGLGYKFSIEVDPND